LTTVTRHETRRVSQAAILVLVLLAGCRASTDEASLPPGERVHLASIPGVWDYRVRWVAQAGCFPNDGRPGSTCTFDSLVTTITGTVTLSTIDSTHWEFDYSTVRSHIDLWYKVYDYANVCDGAAMNCWLQHPASDSIRLLGDTLLEVYEYVAPGAQTRANVTLRALRQAVPFSMQTAWEFVGPEVPPVFFDSIGHSSTKYAIGVHELRKR
jgi:hypothetical protein